MDDEWDEGEYGDGWSDDDPVDLIECSSCGSEIYEEAQQCPICGEYVARAVRSGTAWEGRPVWWVVLGLIGIFATILMLAR